LITGVICGCENLKRENSLSKLIRKSSKYFIQQFTRHRLRTMVESGAVEKEAKAKFFRYSWEKRVNKFALRELWLRKRFFCTTCSA
jgi:hypothetical protein